MKMRLYEYLDAAFRSEIAVRLLWYQTTCRRWLALYLRLPTNW